MACLVQPDWLDEHHVACPVANERGLWQFVKLDVRDGKLDVLDEPESNYREWVVGRGRWFVLRAFQHGRAQLMTNFSSRPN